MVFKKAGRIDVFEIEVDICDSHVNDAWHQPATPSDPSVCYLGIDIALCALSIKYTNDILYSRSEILMLQC